MLRYKRSRLIAIIAIGAGCLAGGTATTTQTAQAAPGISAASDLGGWNYDQPDLKTMTNVAVVNCVEHPAIESCDRNSRLGSVAV